MNRESDLGGVGQGTEVGSGWQAFSKDLKLCIEGAVERGGIIEVGPLARELGVIVQTVVRYLERHPFAIPLPDRPGCRPQRFYSLLPEPAPTPEGLAAIEAEKRRLLEDRLGVQAGADFEALVAQRTLLVGQKRKNGKVVQKF